MSKRFACWAGLVAVASLSLAGAAEAQPARNSVERNRAAMCAKADFDGDSYRPFVCDPVCTCLSTVEPVGPSHACVESASGVFDLIDDDPRVPRCTSLCWDFATSTTGDSCASDLDCPIDDHGPCSGGLCQGQGLPYSVVCSTDADCVIRQPCLTSDPFTPEIKVAYCPEPGIQCAVDSDCASGSNCVAGSCQTLCSVTADCSAGFSCNLSGICMILSGPGSVCDVPDLAAPVTCSSPLPPLPVLTLIGVVPADSPEVVQCNVGQTSTLTNSNDALECIAQIEAAIGQPCTPAP